MPFQVEVSGRKALESMKGKVLILMPTAVIWECALSRFIIIKRGSRRFHPRPFPKRLVELRTE